MRLKAKSPWYSSRKRTSARDPAGAAAPPVRRAPGAAVQVGAVHARLQDLQGDALEQYGALRRRL